MLRYEICIQLSRFTGNSSLICKNHKILTNFVMLKSLNKYLACFLLVTFSWVILPTHTIHDLFANHNDTDSNFCARYHSHLGLHVEKKHTHCEILKINTPVYDSPPLFIFEKIDAGFISEIKTNLQSVYFNQKYFNLPSRAPPVC